MAEIYISIKQSYMCILLFLFLLGLIRFRKRLCSAAPEIEAEPNQKKKKPESVKEEEGKTESSGLTASGTRPARTTASRTTPSCSCKGCVISPPTQFSSLCPLFLVVVAANSHSLP
jgi:hypothetical protein